MKAAFFQTHGGPEVLQYGSQAEPIAGPDEVLVRVRASALNHLDIFVRQGIPGLNLAMPHIGGSDIAGEIAAIGDDVTGWQEGEHVVVNPNLWCGECEMCLRGEESLCVQYAIIGEHVNGGTAEYIAVPAVNLRRIPEDFSWEDAAAVPLVWMTAWRALMGQGQLQAGQSVVILGAGGGVASAAIQIARYAGATVYAASRSEDKLERAKELGADYTLITNDSWSKELWRMTEKRGVDLVLENVGAATWQQSLRAVAPGGRIVTYGATSGPVVQLNLPHLFWNQYAIIGSTMANNSQWETVTRLMFDERRFKPLVDRIFPLSDIREAHEYLESAEQFGKVVLKP